MEAISVTYWNKLADQLIVIGSLLAGFSITVIANLLVSDINTRLAQNIMRTAILAASFFLVSVFAMTRVLMMSTEGFPFPATASDFRTSSALGGVSLLCGILSLIVLIALAGWTRSRSMGRFTTVVGIVTFVLIMYVLA